MEMIVSGFVGSEDDRHICIMFIDGQKSAEGSVPECKIIKNHGFEPDEVEQLETYLRVNAKLISDEAKNINPLKAMMK
jgi:hypothetical protein